MNAQFRLLDRQGLLRGDLNYLQRLALQEVIKMEIKEDIRREKLRFKAQAALKYPESASRILAEKEEEDPVAEIEDYNPDNPGFSQQSIETMLESLEKFGFHREIQED